MERLTRDVNNLALRGAGRTPTFVFAVVAILGIGTAVAMLTTLDTALLRQLPARDQARLAVFGTYREPMVEETAPGILFALDSAPDDGPGSGAFKTFTGAVMFAAGRGRLDIVEKSGGPVIAVNGVTIAGPLAGSGDYYLFDSTGFVLVRPANKTFSSFSLTHASYNYRENRDGWPDWFLLHPFQADTVGVGDDPRLTQHGFLPIYWHLDLRHGEAGQALARGWLAIRDTPAGEASVARWFGATEALANLPFGAGALLGKSLGVTSVARLSPATALAGGERTSSAGVLNDIVTLHAISDLKTSDVELSQLVLPPGFAETSWPGFDRAQNLPDLSPDRGARWRATPKKAP